MITIKNNIGFFCLVVMGSFFTSCSTDEKQTVVTKTQLVMSDEFNVDGAPNSELWSYNIGTGSNGWGNNELQYYTSRPSNIKVENGMLNITARNEQYMGKSYTSARILTKGKFEKKYGRIEARIKLPRGKGLWPAFWMLGANSDTVTWPLCGEIDIMEYLGDKPTEIFGHYTVQVILAALQSVRLLLYQTADLILISIFLELNGIRIILISMWITSCTIKLHQLMFLEIGFLTNHFTLS